MGKLGQQRRSRIRMTNYNISKAREIQDIKLNKIEMLEHEIVKIMQDNKVLSSNCATEKEKCLKIEQENIDFKSKIFKLECKIFKLESTTSNTILVKQQVDQALLAQKERHNIRHESIVKLLQERNQTKIDSLSESYQSQIDELVSRLNTLSEELSIARQCLLKSNIRKPIFSPGRYNGIPP